MKETLVVIVGPTAVGKTKTGVELAKAFNGEVISGDSMQIYKGMDIGTAKVTPEEMQGITHHLINIKEPTESFSVAEFQEVAKPLITQINQQGNVPFMVGGTGLYVKAVTHNYQFGDTPQDLAYRRDLENIVESEGVEALHEKLKSVDPVAFETIHPNNFRRVIRALEIFKVTNQTYTEYQQDQHHDSPYHIVMIGLTMERKKLYERIDKRVDQMVEEGLLIEAQCLYDQGVRDCQSVQAIGYKEIYEYIEGKRTKEDAIDLLKRNSRRYAKRQLTWFRNKANVDWFDVTDLNFDRTITEITNFVEGKLKEIAK